MTTLLAPFTSRRFASSLPGIISNQLFKKVQRWATIGTFGAGAGHELGDGGKLISIVKKICAPREKEC